MATSEKAQHLCPTDATRRSRLSPVSTIPERAAVAPPVMDVVQNLRKLRLERDTLLRYIKLFTESRALINLARVKGLTLLSSPEPEHLSTKSLVTPDVSKNKHGVGCQSSPRLSRTPAAGIASINWLTGTVLDHHGDKVQMTPENVADHLKLRHQSHARLLAARRRRSKYDVASLAQQKVLKLQMENRRMKVLICKVTIFLRARKRVRMGLARLSKENEKNNQSISA